MRGLSRLTERQRIVLQVIQAEFAETGEPMLRRDLAQRIGTKKGQVDRFVRTLSSCGFVNARDGGVVPLYV